MQVISRRVSEGIVFEGLANVTVIDITGQEVTLEITGPDGEVERVTMTCPPTETRSETVEELAAVTC